MGLRNLGERVFAVVVRRRRRDMTLRKGARCTFRVTNGVSGDLLGAEQSQESSCSWDQFLFVSLYAAAAYDPVSPFNGV